MKNPNNPCIFCKIRKEEIQYENQLAYSSIDSYPVSKFHSLIVPKRHVDNYFELSTEEVQACHELILKTKSFFFNVVYIFETWFQSNFSILS